MASHGQSNFSVRKHAGSLCVLCDAPALHLSNLSPGVKTSSYYILPIHAMPRNWHTLTHFWASSSSNMLQYAPICSNLLGNLQSCLVLKFEAESHHVRLGKSASTTPPTARCHTTPTASTKAGCSRMLVQTEPQVVLEIDIDSFHNCLYQVLSISNAQLSRITGSASNVSDEMRSQLKKMKIVGADVCTWHALKQLGGPSTTELQNCNYLWLPYNLIYLDV